MIEIPEHVLGIVDRMAEQSHSVEEFREELTTQNSPLFQGTEQEVRNAIYRRIVDFYEQGLFSAEQIDGQRNEVITQKQLMQALNGAARSRRNKECGEEAFCVLKYIEDAKHCAWSQDDEGIQKKIFKLAKSEQQFTQILEEKNGVEITGELGKIRVAMVQIPLEELLKKKRVCRAYRDLWMIQKKRGGQRRKIDFDVFYLWNGIKPTAEYYIYIAD